MALLSVEKNGVLSLHSFTSFFRHFPSLPLWTIGRRSGLWRSAEIPLLFGPHRIVVVVVVVVVLFFFPFSSLSLSLSASAECRVLSLSLPP